jgi:hypothetical protein
MCSSHPDSGPDEGNGNVRPGWQSALVACRLGAACGHGVESIGPQWLVERSLSGGSSAPPAHPDSPHPRRGQQQADCPFASSIKRLHPAP